MIYIILKAGLDGFTSKITFYRAFFLCKVNQ